MKTTFLVSCAIGSLVSMVSLCGAATPVRTDRDPSKTPEGLSDTDWSGIRGAYEKNRHAIIANPDGSHQARNPGQAWLTKFDGRGFTVTPDAAGWSWGLELVGYGDVTQVREDGGKISYVRGDGLTEWFVNDARGLEQGWTLGKRPEREGTSGPLRLHLAIRGSLRPQVSAGGAGMAFVNETGGVTLNYGGLNAWDADGKPLPARFAEHEAAGSELCVVVDDTDARYPITIDPVAQQAYLKASNAESHDSFGYAVAISGDTVVVGARAESSLATGVNGNQADNSATSAGAAYVFVRSGGTWTQQAYLKASNAEGGDFFGSAVAVSGDTVVVGAYAEDSAATGIDGNQGDNAAVSAGAAYVFTRSGTTWSQQAYLKASNAETSDYFGYSVAVSGDTVVVGAVWEDSIATGVDGNQAENSAPNAGAAYVFVRTGTTWSQQSYLKASNTGTNDYFGFAVSLSGDTLVVGAYGEDSAATGIDGNQNDNSIGYAGAAYVFTRSGTTWSQQAYLKASNAGPSDYFGCSVAASGDTVVVGAFFEDSNATEVNGNQSDNSATNAGAAYVFTRSGTTWSQQAYLKASNAETGDSFGRSVAISGNTVVVSAPHEDSAATGVDGNQSDNSATTAGAAYVFTRSGTTWRQVAYLKASNAEASDLFSGSITTFPPTSLPSTQGVAVSGDTVVVGAYGEDSAATGVDGNQANNSAAGAGAAYVFEVRASYTLSATPPVNGEVSGGGVYPEGAVASLIAMPNPGYRFTAWTGDASGTANPLSIVMNSNKTVGATFSPDLTDSDSDGLTAFDEAVIYGTDPTKDDTDGDGLKDGWEVTAGTNPLLADTDGDGLNDSAEITAGTNPLVADTDGDGLNDGQEINLTHTNPKLADSNGNGINDGLEDSDNDGLGNLVEITQYGTDPLIADTDGDGLNDAAEVHYAGSFFKLVQGSFTYPQAVADAAAKRGRVAGFPNAADYSRMAGQARQTTQGYLWIGLADAATEGAWLWTDGSPASYNRWLAGEPSGGAAENHVVIMENTTLWADTADNFVAAGYLFERVGSNPLDPDTDADGLTDGQEMNTTHSSPLLDDTDGDDLPDGAEVNTYGSSPLLADTDADGLNDRVEVEIYHSNPALKDSDGDGFDDLFEVNTGFDPALATSTPDAQSSIRTAVEFRFNAASGVSYRIEASTDLNAWDIIEPVIIGQSAVVTRFYSTENQPKRYFRVRRN